MIGSRECDYSEPRTRYTNDTARRCSCGHAADATCATCGAEVCEDHAMLCEEQACFDAAKLYCLRCTSLVEDIRLCARHAMTCPAGEEE